jgi:glycerol-3-phosphate dehydrogenase
LVGTTDVAWGAAPDQPTIDDEEIGYLLETIDRNFDRTVTRDDIVWSYSGLRALVDDGSSDPSRVTRDYVLELDKEGAPLLSIFGGKLTTYRRLAERAVDRVAQFFPGVSGAWTERAFLPGGVIPNHDVAGYSRELAERYPALSKELISRLVRTYGTRTERLLESVTSESDLGEHFGAGLYAREVDYLVANEWVRTAQDLAWRRTKLGMHLAHDQVARLEKYLRKKIGPV